MLNKIINITAGSDYKSANKPTNFSKYFHAANSAGLDFHDTINFSPAANFLKQINWQLKEISHSSNDKLNLIFIIAEYEFQTVVDLSGFVKMSSISFNVSAERTTLVKGSKISAELTVSLKDVQPLESFEAFKFSYLSVLFDRLFLLNVSSELNKYDSDALNNLLDGIEDGLKKEFDYLNSALFTFIEKLFGKKNIQIEIPELIIVEPISLERIKSLNA